MLVLKFIVWVCVHVSVCTCACSHVCMCVCVHVCVYFIAKHYNVTISNVMLPNMNSRGAKIKIYTRERAGQK